MPIYAYQCDACGFAKDVLQKISDAPLSDCPACGQARFRKQVTAAGFQLKGSGWYATDFKGGASSSAAKGEDAGKNEGTGQAKGESAKPASDSATAGAAAASGSPAAAAS